MEPVESLVVFAQKLREFRHEHPELEGDHRAPAVLVHVLVVLKVQVRTIQVAKGLGLDLGHGELPKLDQERDSSKPNLQITRDEECDIFVKCASNLN